jgi:hypothetical protein
MKLKSLPHTAGNVIRYILDYEQFLEPGTTITAFTAVLAPGSSTTATITQTSVNPEGEGVFFVNGGAVNEVFTVNLQGTDSRGEIVNDTVVFTVVAP